MKDTNVEKCVHCNICKINCMFLSKYDIDLSDFSKCKELAYSCFLCGKCKEVCPKDIDGALIGKLHRENLVSNVDFKNIVYKQYKKILWEKNDYKFSNYRKAKTKSVLFPGCSFPSFFPKTMVKLEKIFAKHNIGVVFECCRKPVAELGLRKEADSGLECIINKLKEQGVEEIIVLCPNCYYYMKDKIDIKIKSVYEKLREIREGNKIDICEIQMYYPCPDRENLEIYKDMKFFIAGQFKNSLNKIQCCGLGGCGFIKEPILSREMIKQVNNKDELLYTYCASCVGNFRRNGYLYVYHVLPTILSVNENISLGIKPLINRVKRKFV